MSARSGKRWTWLKGTLTAVLAPFQRVLTQSDLDTDRLRALGVAQAETTGSLKFASPPLPADDDALARLSPRFASAPVWMFASARGDEPRIALEIHRAVRERTPGARLLLAPRHPGRGAEIATLADEFGFAFALRSQGDAPGERTDVFIADRLGEMGLWYRLVAVSLVGGGFGGMGGQNPLEPALRGCPVIFGPDMSNFARIEQDMLDAGGGAKVHGPEDAAATVARCLGDPDERRRMAEAAESSAKAQAGVIDDIMDRIAAMLDPICG